MKSFFILIILLSSTIMKAQNLLMNGSFEDENICTEFIKNCAPEGWISTSLRSDYYFDDVKNAYDGQHFAGLIAITSSPRSRNYLRSRILCGLRPGASYLLEFFTRSEHPVLDSVGIYFSADDILYRKTGMKNTVPQLWLKNGLATTSTTTWQKVSLVYTASGTENFIVIGDFKTQGYQLRGRPDLGKDFYFFIDDISLVPVDRNERICSQADSVRAEEYEVNERHNMLEKKVYIYSRNPPAITPLPRTILQRIDTLVIPDVLFATSSYMLNAGASKLLDSFISKTRTSNIDSMVVEGHTDSIGLVAANQKLSMNRASSVAGYLQPHYSYRIITRGWASERPVADNRTKEGRQKNRRVEIYLYVRE